MDWIITRENFPDGCLDGRYLLRCVHLLAVKIPHVKNIHHLVHLGGDLGDPDIQTALEQRIGHPEQQAGKVECHHLDNCKKA